MRQAECKDAYMSDVRFSIFDGLFGIEATDEVLDLYEDWVRWRQVIVQQRVGLIILIHGDYDLK